MATGRPLTEMIDEEENELVTLLGMVEADMIRESVYKEFYDTYYKYTWTYFNEIAYVAPTFKMVHEKNKENQGPMSEGLFDPNFEEKLKD